MIDLIYCAAGNRKFAEIAINHGFLYGAQLPATVYFPPYFADQNWKNPDREAYIAALAEHKPFLASVLDWEHEEQLPEVLAWAEDAAQHVETVMIIPKVIGQVHRVPDVVGGKPVRLGYSVPTSHGGTPCLPWEFGKRPVHLLGGSPNKQLKYAHIFPNVVSVDGNYMMKMASRFCQFWAGKKVPYGSNPWWPTLREANGGDNWVNAEVEEGEPSEAPYEAFERSCINIMKAWREIDANLEQDYSTLPLFR